MSGKADVIWSIEPHTQAKHEILRYYLGAWFPILATTQRRLVYVDGFAGPGEYEGAEDGSPIIALKVARDHIFKDKLQRSGMNLVFFFIEKDESRFQNLQRMLGKLQLPANFKIITECNSFALAFGDVLTELEQQKKQLAPAFVFIDPFGPTGFPMSLIERLAKQAKSEVLITFNYQSLIQWFLQDESKHDHIDELYGSGIWRPALNILDSNKKEACRCSTQYSHKPLTEATVVRITSHAVAEYWPAYYRRTHGISCGEYSKLEEKSAASNSILSLPGIQVDPMIQSTPVATSTYECAETAS